MRIIKVDHAKNSVKVKLENFFDFSLLLLILKKGDILISKIFFVDKNFETKERVLVYAELEVVTRVYEDNMVHIKTLIKHCEIGVGSFFSFKVQKNSIFNIKFKEDWQIRYLLKNNIIGEQKNIFFRYVSYHEAEIYNCGQSLYNFAYSFNFIKRKRFEKELEKDIYKDCQTILENIILDEKNFLILRLEKHPSNEKLLEGLQLLKKNNLQTLICGQKILPLQFFKQRKSQYLDVSLLQIQILVKEALLSSNFEYISLLSFDYLVQFSLIVLLLEDFQNLSPEEKQKLWGSDLKTIILLRHPAFEAFPSKSFGIFKYSKY
jgi:hypothetical protein